MNSQLSKGILDLVLLLQLSIEDSYAYKMSKFVTTSIGVTEGAVYPVLRRLETKKLISSYDVPNGKRSRKYFHLLPEGEAHLDTLIYQWKEISDVIIKLEGSHQDGD
ncbi:PadR family transcriptional regulator [Lactiplantibacillus plantarum]|uniref:PadR family transcriptional regulator n=1 Tax=Lactiplantibacillus plantarum TaxID=1590 RepID=UPI0007C76FA0|nr:PadR family transcriptional regulator [Lactiplantibacillus plantarum]AYE59644.1 PadR family transcriptional regulator [Lactiplantibacillus plantarum]QBJ54710.1 PadR family transcriptional regulator [Lactiplantibacillus plantarum]